MVETTPTSGGTSGRGHTAAATVVSAGVRRPRSRRAYHPASHLSILRSTLSFVCIYSVGHRSRDHVLDHGICGGVVVAGQRARGHDRRQQPPRPRRRSRSRSHEQHHQRRATAHCTRSHGHGARASTATLSTTTRESKQWHGCVVRFDAVRAVEHGAHGLLLDRRVDRRRALPRYHSLSRSHTYTRQALVLTPCPNTRAIVNDQYWCCCWESSSPHRTLRASTSEMVQPPPPPLQLQQLQQLHSPIESIAHICMASPQPIAYLLVRSRQSSSPRSSCEAMRTCSTLNVERDSS